MEDTLNEMIEDLIVLADKGYGESKVSIYCKNCDCLDRYPGATASKDIQITINAGA